MRSKSYVLFALLAGLLLAVYGSLFTADFLPWDDDYNISLNPIYLQGSLLSFWKQAFYGMYIPITSTVWGWLFEIGGGDALPFRIFNFSVHAINVFLISWVLRDWVRRLRIEPNWLWMVGTVVFAFHPMQVETVAWISGGRDLLATTFALLALFFYFRWSDWRGFAMGGVFFLLGLFSKPQVSSLPIVIFLLTAITDRSQWKRHFLKMFVWSLPVLAVAYLTFTEQKEYVAKTVDLTLRTLVIFDSFGFYLGKLLWPNPLAVDYGRNPTWIWNHPKALWQSLLPFGCALLALAYRFYRGLRTPLLLFFIWMALLLPVSGIVDFAYQDISTTADHYVYFPMFGFLLLGLFLMQRPAQKFPKTFLASFALIALTLTGLSWHRAQVWQDRFSFFEDMHEKNPNSYSAFIGLGGNAAQKEDNIKALEHYRAALNQRHYDVAATANVLSTLFRLKRHQEIFDQETYLLHPLFQRALLTHHIASANILSTFGVTAYALRKMDLSFLYLCEAAAINPFNSAIQQGRDAILQLARQNKIADQCPVFSSEAEFLNTVQRSLATRRNQGP